MVQETGEHVIVTAGELHLERCLKDLRERFAKIEIQAGSSIVPFRESCAKVASNIQSMESFIQSNFGNVRLEDSAMGSVCLATPNKLCKITVRAVPLPQAATRFLYDNEHVIKGIVDGKEANPQQFLTEFVECFQEDEPSFDLDRLWDFGPKRCGCNILFNGIPGFTRKGYVAINFRWRSVGTYDQLKEPELTDVQAILKETDNEPLDYQAITVRHIQGSINSGFQLATQSGPLCNEPMMGISFTVENVEFFVDKDTDSLQIGLLSGQVISTMKEACRLAFLSWSPRLSLAMYSCELSAPCKSWSNSS